MGRTAGEWGLMGGRPAWRAADGGGVGGAEAESESRPGGRAGGRDIL